MFLKHDPIGILQEKILQTPELVGLAFQLYPEWVVEEYDNHCAAEFYLDHGINRFSPPGLKQPFLFTFVKIDRYSLLLSMLPVSLQLVARG